MSKIEGVAKKFDDAAIDYVLIFNWDTGSSLGVSIPDTGGNWSYTYSNSSKIGVTYIANGCNPLTHGPYDIVATTISGIYGYLMLCYAGRTSLPEYELDKSNTEHPDWDRNFKNAAPEQFLKYKHTAVGMAESVIPTEVLDYFNIDWIIEVRDYNLNSDVSNHLSTVEFLNDAGGVVLALKFASVVGGSGLWYGTSLTNLLRASQKTNTYGELSFTATSVVYRNTNTNLGNGSFTLSVDMLTVVSLRVTGYALAKNNDGDSRSVYSGTSLRVVSPILT